MAINEITKEFTYDLPDDIYHQTNDLGKKARVIYKGPDKVYVWVDSITNKLIRCESGGEVGQQLFNGELPFPQGDHYMVEVRPEDSNTECIIAGLFEGVDPHSIPDIEEDVPGQDTPYVRDKYPVPNHTYEITEIEYSPQAEQWVTPLPWRKPIMTWEEKVAYRDNQLQNSDRLYSEDLPSGLITKIQEYRTYLRDITETVGVAWTATVPTGGSGYSVGDMLLVQDPKYKNTQVVDEVKLTVTKVSGSGAITEFSVENKRALYHPEAAVYTECFFVTNGSGTGAKVTLTKVKQVDPWKVKWRESPLFTRPTSWNKVTKANSVATDTEDAHAFEEAEKTYNPALSTAVE
jgi:hypothetical protein